MFSSSFWLEPSEEMNAYQDLTCLRFWFSCGSPLLSCQWKLCLWSVRVSSAEPASIGASVGLPPLLAVRRYTVFLRCTTGFDSFFVNISEAFPALRTVIDLDGSLSISSAVVSSDPLLFGHWFLVSQLLLFNEFDMGVTTFDWIGCVVRAVRWWPVMFFPFSAPTCIGRWPTKLLSQFANLTRLPSHLSIVFLLEFAAEINDSRLFDLFDVNDDEVCAVSDDVVDSELFLSLTTIDCLALDSFSWLSLGTGPPVESMQRFGCGGSGKCVDQSGWVLWCTCCCGDATNDGNVDLFTDTLEYT